MSGEMIAIVAVGVALAGVILTSLKGTETRLREDMKQLSERVARVEHSQAKPSQAKPSQAKPSQAKPSQAKPSQAKLEGLLDVLREAITVRATGS